MSIRDPEIVSEWHHASESSGGLYRVVPADYDLPDQLVEPVQPVNDGTGIATTASLNGAGQQIACEGCRKPIMATDLPTQGQRIGSLVCGGCSAGQGKESLVQKAKRAVGRPRGRVTS